MTGRKEEIRILNERYNRDEAQFIAVYGRRRVGKTYLINETFKDKITFRHAGLSPVEMSESEGNSPLQKQLKHFYNSLLLHGMKNSKCPSDWLEAFFMLEMFLQSMDNGSKQLVFIDELPWLDTPKSGFITGLEAFWNNWACHRHNFMLVVCGSATSWIVDKLINNHGGLYNRLTYEIKLSPFTLRECEEFFEEKHIRMSRYDIVQSYMIFGGIPYYLNYFQNGLSLAQNVDNILFKKNAPLKAEFDRLFMSTFNNPEYVMDIIRFLDTKNAGFTRTEISQKTGHSNGSNLTATLNSLIASDFVIRYVPFGMGKRDECYKLTDPFCMFYLKFAEEQDFPSRSLWQENQVSPSVTSWRGFAFENVCFNHIDQIKEALGIRGVISRQSAWSKREDDKDGTQIDLIIDRNDNVVNMCEIKFYSREFTVTKEYDRILRNRRSLLSQELSPKKGIHSTIITTFGVTYNEYKWSFDRIVTMDDLFA